MCNVRPELACPELAEVSQGNQTVLRNGIGFLPKACVATSPQTESRQTLAVEKN